MLLAQNCLILACFFSVFGIVMERRRFLLYSFLAMGCAVLSYLNLTIRIKQSSGRFSAAPSGYGIPCSQLPVRGGKGRLCILQILLLGYTGIVKSTGMFFAGIAGAYAIWKIVRPGKTVPGKILPGKAAEARSRRFLYVALLIMGMALPSLAWRYHLKTDLAGFTGKVRDCGRKSRRDSGGRGLYGSVIRDFITAALDSAGRAVQIFLLCNGLALQPSSMQGLR